MRGDEQLVEAWMRIRAASPTAADLFLEQLRYVTALKANDLVQAPVETIQMVQGVARGYADLTKLLINAPTIFQKAQELRNARPAHSSPPA